MSQHSLFIVPAEHKAWFDDQANALGNDGPALVMALSPNGQAPSTHGWCGVSLSLEKETQVQALIDANPSMSVVWRKYDIGAQPNYPDVVLQELGLKRIVTPMI